MINGKITELGISQTYQSGVFLTSEAQTSARNSRAAEAEVWSVSNPGISLYPVGQGDQSENGCAREFCSFYRKIATHTDTKDKKAIEVRKAIDQQSGPYCAGRFFSKAGSCQKGRDKLKSHLAMIGYGSKNSRRCIISLFHRTRQLLSVIKLLMD